MSRARTSLLARTFFTRFFESDLMPAGQPQVQLLIWSMVFLAAPGLLLPSRFSYKYFVLQFDAAALSRALLLDRLLFITLTMTALGLVALVIWDGVFPDRRDAIAFGVLPVPGRELVVSRLAALGVVAAFFCLGTNAIPTVFYGPVIAAFGAATNPIRGAAAHLLATSLAGAFTFFALIALQGLLLNLAGRRTAQRLSLALQVLFSVGMLQMIFFLPRMGSVIHTDLRGAAEDPWLRLLPSVWFLGLYDVAGGRPAAGSARLALYAVLATGAAVVGSVALFAATHGRLMKLALESKERFAASGSLRRAALLLSIVVPRPPVERAVFAFTLQTLARSRRHRMLLAMYVGLGLALVLSAIAPLAVARGWRAFASPRVAVLSAPLVLMFFTLTGMRALFAIPIEPKARWVFRVAEPANRWSAVQGARAAMVRAAVFPITAIAAVTAALLWGWQVAAMHALVCLLMGILLADVLCIGLHKIPFACSYFPGRSRLRTLWPFYLMAFTNYSYTTADFELVMFDHPTARVVFWSLVALSIAAAAIARWRSLAWEPGFRFEEEDPDALFTGFNLSEGLAAGASREPRRESPIVTS